VQLCTSGAVDQCVDIDTEVMNARQGPWGGHRIAANVGIALAPFILFGNTADVDW
jgi:hypothetical protein